MSRPTASDPLAYIVEQLESDIDRAYQKCVEIRDIYKAKSTRAQLETLSITLSSGRQFVWGRYSGISGYGNNSDTEAAKAALREDLVGFSRRMNEMISRLSRYTYPFNVHHDHMHDHHPYHSTLHEFVFGCEHHGHPRHHHSHHHHHHHESRYDPHPHHHIDTMLANQVREWESIKDGVVQAFARYRDMVDEKKRERDDKQKRKKKADEKKKEAVEKAEKHEKERTEREKARADKLAAEVKEYKEEQKVLRQREQARQEHLQDRVNDLGERALAEYGSSRRQGVESRHANADADIDRLHHLVRVVNNLDLAYRPPSQAVARPEIGCVPYPPVPPFPGYYYDDLDYWGYPVRYHDQRHHHHLARRRRAATVIGNEEERQTPVIIQNNVHGGDVEVEENNSVSGRSPTTSRIGFARHVRPARSDDSDADSVETLTVPMGRRGDLHMTVFGHRNGNWHRHNHRPHYYIYDGDHGHGDHWPYGRAHHTHDRVYIVKD